MRRKEAEEMLKKIKKVKGITIIIAVAMLVIAILGVKFSHNDTEYTVTITGKDRITESSKESDGNYKTSSKYLVFADDENGNSLVFENTDCLFRWKFNSSNVQGKLKEGHTYKITVIGYRNSFLSWYQNIIKVEEVKR